MADVERIQLAHGGGGQLTSELVCDVILPALGAGGSQAPEGLTDAAVLDAPRGRLAFTTDSYVVQPLEFPGGDIGKLAVCGTVNDLAVGGARPIALSLGLVIQEGLEIALLRRVLESAGRAAAEAGVAIATGDTKVVERAALDGLVMNTAGVGVVSEEARLGFERIWAGDRVLLSGPLGEHGLAVMCRRKGLSLTTELRSDCAAVHELTAALIDRFREAVRFLRDPTRGGLAATLVEAAEGAGRDIEIVEAAIPTNRAAKSAAEILGLDLLSVANEGKLVAFVADDAAEDARALLAENPLAGRAAVIGTVGETAGVPCVEMGTEIGGRRIVQMPYGEELPRIC
jgi:hydrogenase expression/formation protein HypE